MQTAKLSVKEMKNVYGRESYLLSHYQDIVYMARDQKNVNFSTGGGLRYILHCSAPFCHEMTRKH